MGIAKYRKWIMGYSKDFGWNGLAHAAEQTWTKSDSSKLSLMSYYWQN